MSLRSCLFLASSTMSLQGSRAAPSPAEEDDPMLSRRECQEPPLELIRKLTEEEEDEEQRACSAGELVEEEEKDLEKVDEVLAASAFCLWPSFLLFWWSTLCCRPLSPARLLTPISGTLRPLLVDPELLLLLLPLLSMLLWLPLFLMPPSRFIFGILGRSFIPFGGS